MPRFPERFAASDRKLWKSFGIEPEQRSLYLERTGSSVRAQIVGEGPTVVFVHGASNAGTSWINLVARLSGLCCVLVDRPGCGLSDPVNRDMTDLATFNSFADAFVVDVVDALGVDTASVAVTSFGGYFGLRGAVAHPDRLAKLVALGWSIGARADRIPFMMKAGSNPMLSKLTASMKAPRPIVVSLLKQIGLRGALESGNFDAGMIDWFRSLLNDTNTLRNEITSSPRIITMSGANASVELDASLLGKIACPSLFLWGRDDPFGGEAEAKRFTSMIPNAALELVDGGHAVWIDDPGGIAARVQSFLSG